MQLVSHRFEAMNPQGVNLSQLNLAPGYYLLQTVPNQLTPPAAQVQPLSAFQQIQGEPSRPPRKDSLSEILQNSTNNFDKPTIDQSIPLEDLSVRLERETSPNEECKETKKLLTKMTEYEFVMNTKPSRRKRSQRGVRRDRKGAWPCQICGKVLTRGSTLRIHLRKHFGVTSYSCPEDNCNRSFTEKGNCLKHLQIKHDIENGSPEYNEAKQELDRYEKQELEKSQSSITPAVVEAPASPATSTSTLPVEEEQHHENLV